MPLVPGGTDPLRGVARRAAGDVLARSQPAPDSAGQSPPRSWLGFEPGQRQRRVVLFAEPLLRHAQSLL